MSRGETELSEITSRPNSQNKPPIKQQTDTISSPDEPDDHFETANDDNNPYQHQGYPFFHPRFQQQSLEPHEKVNHWKDFVAFIATYWTSFVLTMWGLFVRTPRDFKDEVVGFVRNPKQIIVEVLAGLSIAIVVLPEAIAFTNMVEMPPMAGLHSAMIICLSCAILGARPAMISGAAASTFSILGAFAKNDSFMEEFTLQERHNVIFMSVILSGCFQVIISITRLAPYFIKLLPHSVLIGFCNALAISIAKSQIHLFEKCLPVEDPPGTFTIVKFNSCPKDNLVWFNMGELELWLIFILLFIAILIMIFFPKVPYLGKIIPPSLIAFIVCTMIEHLIYRKAFDVKTRTLEESIPLEGGMPKLNFPTVTVTDKLNPWSNIILYAVYVGFVGCLESLLTVAAMNQVLKVKTTDQHLNREAMAQGVGNIISGCLSSLGGCGTVGESLLNLVNNSRHRLSAIVSGCTIIIIILWAAPAVNLVPMASLTAVILCITFHTFYWPTFIIWMHIRKSDILIILAVTILSIFTNLGIGTLVGIGIGAITLVLDSFNSFKVDMIDIDLPIPLLPDIQFTSPRDETYTNDASDDGIDEENTNDQNNNNNDDNNNTLKETMVQTSTNNINSNADRSSDIITNITSGIDNNDTGANLPFSPIGDETTGLNSIYETSSPYHSKLDENPPTDTKISPPNDPTMERCAKNKLKKGDDKSDDKKVRMEGSIYALDNYAQIDHYISYHYIPPQEQMSNPLLSVLDGMLSPRSGGIGGDLDDIDMNDGKKITDNGEDNTTAAKQTGDDFNPVNDNNTDNNNRDVIFDRNLQHNTTAATTSATNTTQNTPNTSPQQATISTPTTQLSLQPNTAFGSNNNNNTSPHSKSPAYTTTCSSHCTEASAYDIINESAYITPVRLYRLHGILFFGSVRAISQIAPILDPPFVIIDCSDVTLTDYSASTAFVAMLKQYSELNKRCKLVHLTSQQSRLTILRDPDLRRMLSWIDDTTFIVMTADEVALRKKVKAKYKAEEKQKKKELKQKKKNGSGIENNNDDNAAVTNTG